MGLQHAEGIQFRSEADVVKKDALQILDEPNPDVVRT
jgi:hypothetical protein